MKLLIFYLPRDYKEQLQRIAREKGISYRQLIKDVVYKNILKREPPKASNKSTKQETNDNLLYIVMQQEQIISRLLTLIEKYLRKKENDRL